MEHFLPLAVASLVISLISIILLEHFGPNTSSDNESLSIADDTAVDTEIEKVITEETNKEITTDPTNPIRSVDYSQKILRRNWGVRFA